MMLVPIGAWAEVDFGTENTVSETTLWTFNNLTVSTTYNQYTSMNNAYLRANNSRYYTVNALGEAQNIVLADGRTISIANVLNQNQGASNYSAIPAGTKAGTALVENDCAGFFAFNATVAGTVYLYFKASTGSKVTRIYHSQSVSSEKLTHLATNTSSETPALTCLSCTSTEAGTFFIGGVTTGADIYAVYFAPSDMNVSEATTWTFGEFPNTLTAVHNAGNGLVYRATSSNSRNISFTATSKTLTFGDGYVQSVTAAAVTGAGIDAPTDASPKASSNSSKGCPMLAFNATVPGTVYAKVSGASGTARIYFGNGTATPTQSKSVALSDASSVVDVEYTSTSAGSFFIGSASAGCTIYAIRFVPTSSVTCKWNFDQYYAVNSNVLSTSGTSAINLDGLYLHNNQGHTFSSRMADSKMALRTGGNSVPSLTSKGASDASVQADGFAFDAPCAGTFSWKVYSNSNNETYVNVYKDGTLDETHPMTTTSSGVKELSYTCTSAATLYFIPSVSTYDYIEASFVPTTASGNQKKYVTITSAGKATFCAAQNYTIPDGLTAYYVSNVDTENNTAKMTQITTGVIPACTGVILYGDAGTYEMVSSESATAIEGTNYLVANLASYALPASGTYNSTTQYAYTLSADGFVHVKSTDPGTLAAGKAFLRTTLDVPAGARLAMVFDDNETTGISTVQGSRFMVNGYYNLSGQRVENPTKGLYIVNGKKVVIK